MPFLMWALLRYVSDAELMRDKPQTTTSMLFMFASVVTCVFLSVDGVVAVFSESELARLITAGIVTVLSVCGMVAWLVQNSRENTKASWDATMKKEAAAGLA